MINRQNEKEFQALLVAMRYYYNKAKTIHRIRVIGNIVIALFGVFMVSFFPQIKQLSLVFLPIVSFLWILISRLLLIEWEKKHTKIAATLQEEFDTSLFGIPWQKVLAGSRIDPENIIKADQKFKGDRSKLKDWYIGINAPNPSLNVLLAQRMNLVWDVRLRKRYAVLVGCMTLLYLLCTLFIGRNTNMVAYMLTLLIPSVSILIHGVETCRDHWRRAQSCEKIGREILATYTSKATNIDQDIVLCCREYQDFIFQKRCDTTLIPNGLYWLSRNNDDHTMKQVNEELSRRVIES